MSKLDEDTIKRIQSYPEEVSDSEIGRQLGIRRQTVARYRNEIADTLEPKQEQLTKQEQKKLDLLEHYSEKEIKEMLAYIANSTKKEVNEVLNEP